MRCYGQRRSHFHFPIGTAAMVDITFRLNRWELVDLSYPRNEWVHCWLLFCSWYHSTSDNLAYCLLDTHRQFITRRRRRSHCPKATIEFRGYVQQSRHHRQLVSKRVHTWLVTTPGNNPYAYLTHWASLLVHFVQRSFLMTGISLHSNRIAVAFSGGFSFNIFAPDDIRKW